MIKHVFTRFGIVAAGVAAAFAGTVTQAGAAPAVHDVTPDTVAVAPAAGWDTPNDRSYYLEASCEPYAAAIRQGAAAWNGLTEGGGTPVECRNSYITDCGGGGNIVGCNWGQGQRIALYMGGVNDDALLAAHEFGHDWYGHSDYQCAGWGSPAEVMSPTICNAPLARGGKLPTM
ncbi:hypothetical protein [Solicola gregarius]|uniref:Secreted protein n=1 Tax=Solicola gregarius TaxID=2908642 RepID=A0AA46TI86_9ACTN|nr:hypothetical protein [Solicola gregarius]UYM05312.1 hypothetical protein L0C25_22840 [Solicola gregarius]